MWMWWLAVGLIVAVVEMLTVDFIFIMFVGGALAAMITALLGAPLYAQVLVFAVVSVVALGHGTGAKAVHGHSMTRAEVPLARLNGSPWVRVSVIDATGKRAWSNPIWL